MNVRRTILSASISDSFYQGREQAHGLKIFEENSQDSSVQDESQVIFKYIQVSFNVQDKT